MKTLLLARLWIGVFLFGLACETQVLGIGLPKSWENASVYLEVKRLPGKPCLPKQTFDSADEEQTAPEYCPLGSGFLLQICGNSLLFSNKHVLSVQSVRPVFVRVKNKAGEFVRLSLGKWHGHPNAAIDIAASFLNIPKGTELRDLDYTYFDEDKERHAKEPASLVLKLEDLRVGDDVLLVGYPSSIPNVLEILKSTNTPIFRGGIVALKLPGITRLKFRENTGAQVDKDLKDIFLIDAWSFLGNSGSPVFFRPSLARYSEDRAHVTTERAYIAGIQGATISGTGLTIVYAADGIEETAAQFSGAKCPPPLSVKPSTQ